MAIQIRRREPEAATDSAALLLECHARIRTFSAMARALAAAARTPTRPSAAELAETAGAVRRYFAEALPLHAADEDESITPRLRACAPGEEVLAALDRMSREHGEHRPYLERLVPWWAAVAADPAALSSDAEARCSDTETLMREIESHLELEERVIIPAMRAHFTAELEEELTREMRARRT